MAFEQTLRTVGLPAAADLTSGGTVNPQFYLVTVNASGQINFTGAGAVADGVVQDKPNAQGVEGEVAILGITKLVTGAAVNNGDPLMANASGQAITATSGNFVRCAHWRHRGALASSFPRCFSDQPLLLGPEAPAGDPARRIRHISPKRATFSVSPWRSALLVDSPAVHNRRRTWSR
jgi:hypothetical protein